MRNSSRHGRTRSGITLIELMAYVALLAIVMNMLSTVLLTSANWARAVRRRAESLTWAAFAVDRFKDDVRAAGRATLTACKGQKPGQTLVLTYQGSDKVVRYETEGTGMVRKCTARGVTSSRPLPVPTKSVQIAVDDSASARLVTMTIELPSGNRQMQRGYVLSTSAAIRRPCPAQKGAAKP